MKDRLTLKEIEEFFYDEEIKKLPTIKFCNATKNLNDKNKSSLLNIRGESFGEFLFKNKAEENWIFNIELKIDNGEILLNSSAHLNETNSRTEKYAIGKNLEELFINFFGEEDFIRLKTEKYIKK